TCRSPRGGDQTGGDRVRLIVVRRVIQVVGHEEVPEDPAEEPSVDRDSTAELVLGGERELPAVRPGVPPVSRVVVPRELVTRRVLVHQRRGAGDRTTGVNLYIGRTRPLSRWTGEITIRNEVAVVVVPSPWRGKNDIERAERDEWVAAGDRLAE